MAGWLEERHLISEQELLGRSARGRVGYHWQALVDGDSGGLAPFF